METHQPDTQTNRPRTRAEASRANGAKGKGPVTAEGKARVSQNACKHGLTARKSTVVDPTDLDEFQHYHDAMFETLNPQNVVQATLADFIVQCAWRLRTCTDVEADFMRYRLDQDGRLCKAFMFDIERYQVLGRYSTAIERSMHRALKTFRELQSAKGQTNTQTTP